MSKTFTIGIAGFGRSGSCIHAANIPALGCKFKIVAVADTIEERRKDAETQFGCKTYSGYTDMLKEADFDLFVNATPSRMHVEVGIAALKAGRNLLGEKPHATTVADFDRVLAAAKKAAKIFYPFQNYRFKPSFLKMKEVIDSGVLGDVVAIRINWSGYSRRWDWQTFQKECGGNLLNTGPHPLDHALSFFGEGTPKVFSKLFASHPSGGDADNFMLVILHGKGKPTIEICLNSFQAFPQGDQYNISGTLGGMSGGDKNLEWKYYDPAECPAPAPWQNWSRNREYCSEQITWRSQQWKYDGNEFHVAVQELYRNLHDVLAGKAEPLVKHGQIRRQVAVIEEVRRQNPVLDTPRTSFKT
jgi:predicted dehydrogenase